MVTPEISSEIHTDLEQINHERFLNRIIKILDSK
jgi:hypothetical protein